MAKVTVTKEEAYKSFEKELIIGKSYKYADITNALKKNCKGINEAQISGFVTRSSKLGIFNALKEKNSGHYIYIFMGTNPSRKGSNTVKYYWNRFLIKSDKLMEHKLFALILIPILLYLITELLGHTILS